MKQITTVIEVSDRKIKVFQGQVSKRGCALTACFSRSIDGSSDDEIIEILKSMIGELPKFPINPTFIIPRRLAILRQMKLPSQNLKEIEDMAGLQLVNRIPHSIDEATYHFHLLDQDSRGCCRVLVSVIQREVIQRYLDILRRSGIKDATLTLNSFGILGWVIYQTNIRKIENDQAVGFINIDLDHSEICFCYGSHLFFSRVLSGTWEHVGPDNVRKFIEEIRRSLAVYSSEHLGPEIKKIYILSGADKNEGLERELKYHLGIYVSLINPLENISQDSVVAKTIFEKQEPFSITAGVGALFSDVKGLVHLAPTMTIGKKLMGRQKIRVIKAALLFLFIASLGFLGQVIEISKSKKQLELLTGKADRLHKEAKQAKERIQLVEALDNEIAQYRFIPDLFDALHSLVPEEVSFRLVSLDKEGGLIVQGYARTHAQINDFQTRLIRSPQFHDVNLHFATGRQIARKPVMDFKIAMKMHRNEGGVLW